VAAELLSGLGIDIFKAAQLSPLAFVLNIVIVYPSMLFKMYNQNVVCRMVALANGRSGTGMLNGHSGVPVV